MGILTPFFNLFKPAKTDPLAVQKFNDNMDIIDEEMHRPPLTVNYNAPDGDRNIYLKEVPLATNLSSDNSQMVSGSFVQRTSGGGAPIDDGNAVLLSLKGNMIHTGYVPEVLDMTVSPVERQAPPEITAEIDDATFEEYVETAGTYTLTYTTAWSADPEDYGITVTNTPINGDIITVVWDGVNAPVMTVTAVPRPVPPAITATIDRATFVAYVTSSGTVTLTYTNAWSANPATYGITVSNTPVSGDVITVVYVKEDRGLITPATPATFNSTGWNLYNNSTGYAKVVKYSNTYGYKVGGTYTLLEYAATLSGTRSTITVTNGFFSVPADGYVFVTGGNSTTYIFATWSDWTSGYEGDFRTYTVDTVDLTEVMLLFPNGLLAVGTIRDEINLNSQTAINRVQRLAYTSENIATVIASGLAYDADTNYIYVELSTPVTTAISVDPTYTVDDHGIEFFTGTDVPVVTEILYGENLKNKLQTDVLTISGGLVNNLNSSDTNKALTANMGKTLNSHFTGCETINKQVSSATQYVAASSGWAYIDAFKYTTTKKCLVIANAHVKFTSSSRNVLTIYFGGSRFKVPTVDGEMMFSGCVAMVLDAGSDVTLQVYLNGGDAITYGGSDVRENAVTYTIFPL